MRTRYFIFTSSALIVIEALLILLSWIVYVAMPEAGVRSLLSGEGLRVLLSGYISELSAGGLGLLVLMAVGGGAVVRSGFLKALFNRSSLDFRHRFALQMCYAEVLIAVAAVLVMVFIPHSPMLSVTGHYYPGPLLYGLYSCLVLILLVVSYTYAGFGGDITDYDRAADIVTYGLRHTAWIIVLYLIIVELYSSIKFTLFL